MNKIYINMHETDVETVIHTLSQKISDADNVIAYLNAEWKKTRDELADLKASKGDIENEQRY